MSLALIRGETTSIESFGVVVNKLDSILQDPSFWGQAHMIGDLPAAASMAFPKLELQWYYWTLHLVPTEYPVM